MLLFIEDTGIVQGDIGHGTEGSGVLVLAGTEHGILKIIGTADNGFEAFLIECDNAFPGIANLQGRVLPPLPDQGHICAGNDASFRIHYAEGAAGNLFQLDNNALKNTVGHGRAPLSILHKSTFHKKTSLLYTAFAHIASAF